MNFILFIVAKFSEWLTRRFFYVYGCISSLRRNEFLKYHRQLALAKDHYANVSGQYYLNNNLGVGFGNIKETISSRIGKNERGGTLFDEGKFWRDWLNKRETGHCKNAIDEIV